VSGRGQAQSCLLVALRERKDRISEALDVGPLRLGSELGRPGAELIRTPRRALKPFLHQREYPGVLLGDGRPRSR
jgi:hypothetical protein